MSVDVAGAGDTGTLSGGTGSNTGGAGSTAGGGTLRDGTGGGSVLRKMDGSGTGVGVLVGTLGARGKLTSSGLAKMVLGGMLGGSSIGMLGVSGVARFVSTVVSCWSAAT